MHIEAEIKVNSKLNETNVTLVASGWVTLEECIKFPVTIRKYLDKDTGEPKMFVSYPQRLTDEGYKPVVYPHSESVKKEIEDAVLESMKKDITREKYKPFSEIECRVSLLPLPDAESTKKSIVLRGVATVKVLGITISGIMVKEGEKGLWVQMPQHQSVSGEYKDTVYGITKSAQQQIRETVLEEFEKICQKKQSLQTKFKVR